MGDFTHFDEQGNAVMVDVHAKDDTYRVAVATGKIKVSQEVYEAITNHTAKKGDVLGVARIAGIMAAKKNAELIPLCHIIPLTNCEITYEMSKEESAVIAFCKTSCVGKTGVEMEALTGVSVALLTIYDMCKAIDRRNKMFTVGIVTLSDKGAAGNREDLSGTKIKEMLPDDLYQVLSYRILPDEQKEIEQELVRLSDELHCDLVLTTGGTGFSTRDVTPEATMQVAERNAPGIAEAIRAYSLTITRRAMLSRGVSVIRGKTLIINLPGSPKAVEESLGYILDTLTHGLNILLGREGECAR